MNSYLMQKALAEEFSAASPEGFKITCVKFRVALLRPFLLSY